MTALSALWADGKPINRLQRRVLRDRGAVLHGGFNGHGFVGAKRNFTRPKFQRGNFSVETDYPIGEIEGKEKGVLGGDHAFKGITNKDIARFRPSRGRRQSAKLIRLGNRFLSPRRRPQ
jgi:hypothetical protein